MPSDTDPHPSAGALLRDVPAADLAEHIVAVAQALGGRPSALYVLDIAGTKLRRVAGEGGLPHTLAIPQAIGPELPREQAAGLEATLRAFSADLVLVPLWLRHRAIAAIVCEGRPTQDLDGLAREAAAAMELVDGYTDIFAIARRAEPVSTAAQLQQDLLPPRISAARGAELAAAILPAYDVGGDWIDHSASATGAWLAVGDALGKGLRAAALSALAVAAQRAVRQAGGTLTDSAHAIHEAVLAGGAGEEFMTILLAEWDARDRLLSWVNCGHPAPVLLRHGRPVAPLDGFHTLPVGIADMPPRLELAQVRLRPGDHIVLHTDGVTERRRADGSPFGSDGLAAALTPRPASAVASVAALQDAVLTAGPEALRDDATIMALRIDDDTRHEPPTPGAEA
ncbi:serine/threonine-protein phosphatase [Baekduia soli]|uniref:Serine/threonine-protein phosphatase n=1 Tax=Baekduia soli TaxID=496014 RepID=A0A5B8UA02_9ACTN|nr:PP2C family protein-serine/threonine phosphatase [Baekduia soli]QEC49847.1 serine/threonine-protein phosphatase [Baekduia soli]